MCLFIMLKKIEKADNTIQHQSFFREIFLVFYFKTNKVFTFIKNVSKL